MAPPRNTRESAHTQDPHPRSGPSRGRGRGRGRGGRTINQPRNDNPLPEPQRNNGPRDGATRGATRGARPSRASATPALAPALAPAQTPAQTRRAGSNKRPPPDPEEGQPESRRARLTTSRSNPDPSSTEVVPLRQTRNSSRLADLAIQRTETFGPLESRPQVTTRSRSNQLPSPFEVVPLGRNTNSRQGSLPPGLNAKDSSEWRVLRPRRPAPQPDDAPSNAGLDSRAPSSTRLLRSGSTPRRDTAFIRRPRARRAARSGNKPQSAPQSETLNQSGADQEPDVQLETQVRASQAAPSDTNMSRGSEIPVEDAEAWNRYHERYEQLRLERDQQRTKAIGEGSMTDPAQRTSLRQAITPVGTCTSMCPEFEAVERIVQKMVDRSEKYLHPKTGESQNLQTKMIKRFRRSAAGYDEQLPSDIRTPETLLQTLNYILRNVIGGDEPLGLVHKFAWDRTRSIRNDLSIQQLTEEKDVRIAVKCLERIARFHIISLHLLVSPANTEPFSAHQDREQLNNALLSLLHFYDDNRSRIEFENEDEFRSYYIVFSIQDQRQDLEARIHRWPTELRRGPQVQVALELFAAAGNTWEYQGTLDAKRPNAIAQGFYSRFFQIVNSDSVPYLLACVAEIYFNNVRQTGIRSIWRAYRRHPRSQMHRNEEWTLDEIRNTLFFDTDEETREFCERQLLALSQNTEGKEYLDWGKGDPDSTDVPPSSIQAFSGEYVEPKRCGRSLVAVILGKTVAQAAQSGMIVPSLLAEPLPSQLRAEAESSEAPGESLFVSDDEGRADIMDQGEPEPRTNERTSRQTAYHETQPVPPPMPVAPPGLASSQGVSAAAGSRDRRIGPFLVSPSPSSPPSTHLAPAEEQSTTAVVESTGLGSQHPSLPPSGERLNFPFAMPQTAGHGLVQPAPATAAIVPALGGVSMPSSEPSSGPPEPAGSSHIVGLGSAAPPASTTSGSLFAPIRPDSQKVVSGTQQSESYPVDSTGPMNTATPVAGSVSQSKNRELDGGSAPAFSATTAPAVQTSTQGFAAQVSGRATAFPSAGLFGAAPQRAENQSVGNSLESGGLSIPIPDSQGQFSTPAAPFAGQLEQNFSVPDNTVQHTMEPAALSYPNLNGKQFDEYSMAQTTTTLVDAAVVTQSVFSSQGPAWTGMQANDVGPNTEARSTAPSSMPSNGWVDANLPPPKIGLFDRPAIQDALAVVENRGPFGKPISASTIPSMEGSPAVSVKFSANLEQPSLPMPPSGSEEVRPVVDSTPVGPTLSQTDSIPLGAQLEAKPSEPLPSAPAPPTTIGVLAVQSTQGPTTVEAASLPAAPTDEVPASEAGSWLSSEQVNSFGWRGFLYQVACERREAHRQEVARSKKRALEGEEDDASMGNRKAARVSMEQVTPTVFGPETNVRVSPIAADKAVAIPPPSAVPLVDQDELLLSAARVTADALAKGSHFWENVPSPRPALRPVPAPTESASRNVSPVRGSRIHVNGYEVALAPGSPLGLGRTLSRTEQRIRKTGARGLASRAFLWNPNE